MSKPAPNYYNNRILPHFEFRLSFIPLKTMTTIKLGFFLTHIQQWHVTIRFWKSQAFSWTTLCFILIKCRSRHQIITIIEYHHILKFRLSLYPIKNDDDY